MSPARVVVGVDGGGTGSRAVVLAASGEERARATGRAALVKPGEEHAVQVALRDLVAAALAAAGEMGTPEVLVAGLAGVGRTKTREAVQERLAEAGLARRIQVETDVAVAFHDAFGEGPGILLVGGTGSVALARTPGGRSLRSGGWGAVAGDEGSGWWIGIQALHAAFQAVDGRAPETLLLEAALRHFQVSDPGALMDRLWTAEKGEVAALAPRVAEAAAQGDPASRTILSQAAGALAAHLSPLIRGWREEESGADEIPVALVGGLVVSGGPLRSELLPRIQALGGVTRESAPDPARGAARMALSLLE
jgi:N-acetylglucosamine kinase-like BadF-type ATPase